MIQTLLAKVMGTRNEREMKRLAPMVVRIGELEPSVKPLSDAELAAKTAEFRGRVEKGQPLDELLPEAFAVVREAGRRALGMRHFDVQLIGGMILHSGKIAEMKTGEGKTLVATLPAYLNALEGRGVHVVTVNDYLAKRDSDWMGRIYRFLGLSVGVIQHDLGDRERQAAYAADLTYGTNNEFGFDYLRDNMKFALASMVQRGHRYAIVDEVDSILIDEARTPLIISGPSDESVDRYYSIDKVIPKLKLGATISGHQTQEQREELEETGDYIVDEKAKTVTLTDQGVAHCEKLLGVGNLYDPANMETLHSVNQALRAHVIFKRDVDYMLKDGEVLIVDEFTGRLMPGRRWSDGLHQAVEAKEGVKIERENQTLATITFQNYFRMYDKLSGMTGTADTEAVEFDKIYKLEVIVIPTNRHLIRIENPDLVYQTEDEKFDAVVEEIAECQERGQPTLVGTVSIEKSERLSGMLKRRGIKHVVLNARYHAQEAEIVAQAGRLGAVTIATNMAGRGTDILLGGNPEFLAKQKLLADSPAPAQAGAPKPAPAQVGAPRMDPAEASDEMRAAVLETMKVQCAKEHDEVVAFGGLHIIGTERHEARRIDNQLRGRAGRQGDPGSSRFYLSLEDDLMRIFGGERLKAFMARLNIEQGVPIESPLVSRSIERAQKQVEQRNFETRKHLLEYDDVMNKQRTEIYSLRRELLAGSLQTEYFVSKAEDILEWQLEQHIGERPKEEWGLDELRVQILHNFGIDAAKEGIAEPGQSADEIREKVIERMKASYAGKEAKIGVEMMRQQVRYIALSIIDARWKDHLLAMDHLKEGIGLRAYGQKDPLVEYKRESFDLFAEMKNRIEEEIVRYIFLFEPMTQEEREEEERRKAREREMIFQAASRSRAGPVVQAPAQRDASKVGRNDPCPCGSGKKYKKCHGQSAA